jgi:hypothetical protein
MTISVPGAEVTIDNSQLQNLQAVTITITEAPVTTVTEKPYDSVMLYKCDKCIKIEVHNDYLLQTLSQTKPLSFTSLEKQYYTVFRLYFKDFVRISLIKSFSLFNLF